MDDDEPGSNKNSLKKEWNLLWSTPSGGDQEWPDIEEDFENPKPIKVMTTDELKKLSRSLSQSRKTIHQKLEELQKSVKLYEEKLESARLVNGDISEIEDQLNQYIDAGQDLVQSLQKIDERIKVLQQQKEVLG